MNVTRMPLAAGACIMALTLPGIQAKSKTDSESPRQILEDLRAMAATASNEAASLKMLEDPNRISFGAQHDRLMSLKSEVNRMGQDIAKLKAERDALAPWEQQACDRILPLIQETASTTSKAIEYFNAHPIRLFGPEDQRYAARIQDDSQKIASTLKDYLKYEQLRKDEAWARGQLGTGATD